MIAIRILFIAGLMNFFFGCFYPSLPHVAIGVAVALALWREHELDAQEFLA